MYVPVAQVPDGVTTRNLRLLPIVWIARTAVEPYSLKIPTEQALKEVSHGLPVVRVRSMSDVVSESTARATFDMWLMTTFGSLALLLAAVGIYGLLAYTVQQRTPEIGIRLALGADPRLVGRMVVLQGMGIVLVGTVVSMVAAWNLTRLLATFLFGVTTRDPLIFVTVPLILTGAALVAIWIPARRAVRVDPLMALRAE